jgi:microcystin-dependent protein
MWVWLSSLPTLPTQWPKQGEKVMADPFVGEIRLVSFAQAPTGWALCNGQTLLIADNEALFELIGATYGGDGTTTFGVPDLRGRVPINQGEGAGLSNYALGGRGGVEQNTLAAGNLPAAQVELQLTVHANADSESAKPHNHFPASTSAGNGYASTSDGTTMNAGVVTGTGQVVGDADPFSIVQPYLTVNFIIALQGIFPQ